MKTVAGIQIYVYQILETNSSLMDTTLKSDCQLVRRSVMHISLVWAFLTLERIFISGVHATV